MVSSSPNYRAAVLSMAWLLLPSCAMAETTAAHAHAAMTARSGPSLAASAAYDSKGRLWAVSAAADGVQLRHSDDHGATWSDAARINAESEPVGGDGDARPRMAIGTRDELYVTWTRPLSKPYTGNIRFSRSLDGGRTFSKPIVVHTDRQEITHRFDSMAVAPDGRIYVAWVDKRDQPRGEAAKSWAGASIYYAVSSDRGATFTADWRVAPHSCECCRIALVPRADGKVVAFWRHVFDGNVRDHAMAVLSADGRVDGFRRATFDDWHIEACPHHGGSLAQDAKGRLHAVWFSGAPGREGVYYGVLDRGRVEGQRRIGGDTAEHADIAIIGERIAIAWKEFDGAQSALKAMRSEDGGNTWTEAQLATAAGPNDQPKLLVRDGKFEVLWNTHEKPLRVLPLP